MAGTWDFGPLGVMLKRNMMNACGVSGLISVMIFMGVDAAIIMNPENVGSASGPRGDFRDPLVECKSVMDGFGRINWLMEQPVKASRLKSF